MSEKARWYVVHTYSGYENKVKANLEKTIENRNLQNLLQDIQVPMEEVIEELKKEGLRESLKVMIGGGPISKRFADKIGADGYSANAVEAVKLANRLMSL